MTRIAGALQGAIAQGVVPSAAATLLAELPDSLRNLAIGSLLNGTVLDRSSSGLTMLQTPVGIFGVKTTVPLPAGSNVTLQVQSAGAQLQAIVLSVTPQSPTAPRTPAQSGAPVPSSPSPPTQTTAQVPAEVDGPSGASSTITATVIGPAGGPVPNGATARDLMPSAAALPSSSAADLTPDAKSTSTPAQPTSQPLEEPALPQATLARAVSYLRQLTTPTSPTSGQTPAAATSGSNPSELVTRLLPSGTQVQVRLVALEPAQPAPVTTAAPGHEAPSSTGRSEPSLLTAKLITNPPTPNATQGLPAMIVARTPAGQTIVDTAVGRLLLALPRSMESIQAGNRILIDVLPPDRPAALSGAQSFSASNRPSVLAREWLTMKDALRLLQSASDSSGSATINKVIPKAGPRLAQEILSFINDGANGGAKGVLGEATVRTLERLSGGLVARLDDDLREMLSQQANNDANWRLTIVPILDEHELHQIRFFERRKKNDPQRRRDDSGRFVVECEQSEFGALQIDGLLHERRLDVILRSHTPLPTDAERDLLVLFDQSCAGLGVGGQLSFQCVANFPIHPLDEFKARAVQVSV